MAKKNMTQLARKALLRRGRALLRLRQEVLARGGKKTRTTEPGYLAGLSASERRELEEIHAALERIERGVFGQCVDCGHKVAPERIETLPYQRLCAECEADPLPEEPPVAEQPSFIRA